MEDYCVLCGGILTKNKKFYNCNSNIENCIYCNSLKKHTNFVDRFKKLVEKANEMTSFFDVSKLEKMSNNLPEENRTIFCLLRSGYTVLMRRVNNYFIVEGHNHFVIDKNNIVLWSYFKKPFSVIGENGYIYSQHKILEQAEDSKWSLENEVMPKFNDTFSIVSDMESD